eukprot:7131442-Pyramimonas_sp.AAC.1
MARLAAGCYRDFAAIAEEEGLFFVAEGRTEYTKWCIADELKGGVVSRRHVLVRGVELKGGMDSIDRVGLWSKLAQCWPVPFERQYTPEDCPLVVHQGVAEVAEGVWAQVRTFVQHRPRGSEIIFGGHSLGGAVGFILMCYCRSRLNLPADAISPSYTFGAPPVVARDTSAGSKARVFPAGFRKPIVEPASTSGTELSTNNAGPKTDALVAMQLSPYHVQQYVQGLDIIPRCFLSVDPIWSAAMKNPVLSTVMEWRSSLIGGTLMSSSRFLYELHGLVYLMEWNKIRGTAVKVVSGEAAAEALSHGPALAADVLAAQPMLAVQSLMDHSSQNYAWELTNIVVVEQRRQKKLPPPKS